MQIKKIYSYFFLISNLIKYIFLTKTPVKTMKKKLAIHSENILPIIKKWLYSDKDIFVRELVSNSSDAISKLKIVDNKTKDFSIKISINKDKKTISIEDNGIGMTQEEIEKYISQIAFSGAKDFMEKYQIKDEFIGHFGLGFYSAFMVAKKVDISTLSYKKDETAVFWSSDGTSEYTLEKSDKKTSGTIITLHIDDDSKEFLEEETLKKILTKYCPYLSYPIYLNDNKINKNEPLWLKNPSDVTDKEYIDFYHELYPYDQDPIFWIHLNIDYPFNLKGILYFPKITSNFDIQKSAIKLFCNRVFVSDNLKDILNEYLTVLRGALDSPDLPLNVSRSYLQVDRTIKQLANHISKKISDRLSKIYKTQKDKFLTIFKDIEVIIKLGILQDDKFYERSKEFLLWENLESNYTTIEEYQERNKDKNDNKIFYTTKDKYQDNFLNLYKEKNIEVLFTNPHIDPAVINLLEQKLNVKFARIDGSIEDLLIDKTKEKNVLTKEGKSISSIISSFIKKSISQDIEVEAKSLSNDALPAFIMIKEEERRMRDYLNISQNTDLPLKHTLVVNTNNKLINKISAIKEKDPSLAKDLSNQVYELAMLSQKELNKEAFASFIKRSNSLLEKLAEKI